MDVFIGPGVYLYDWELNIGKIIKVMYKTLNQGWATGSPIIRNGITATQCLLKETTMGWDLLLR